MEKKQSKAFLLQISAGRKPWRRQQMEMVDHERCRKQQLVMTCTLTLIPHIKTNVVFRHNRLVLFLDIDVLV